MTEQNAALLQKVKNYLSSKDDILLVGLISSSSKNDVLNDKFSDLDFYFHAL